MSTDPEDDFGVKIGPGPGDPGPGVRAQPTSRLDGLAKGMDEAIKAASDRIAHCHEHVACPLCGMPVGVECRRMRRGPDGATANREDRPLRFPHRDRWTLVQPAR